MTKMTFKPVILSEDLVVIGLLWIVFMRMRTSAALGCSGDA